MFRWPCSGMVKVGTDGGGGPGSGAGPPCPVVQACGLGAEGTERDAEWGREPRAPRSCSAAHGCPSRGPLLSLARPLALTASPSPSLADSRARGPTASKGGPSQRQGAVGQRAQDGQHPPRGHGDLDGHTRPRGARGGEGLGVPWRGGGRARHRARCRVQLPSHPLSWAWSTELGRFQKGGPAGSCQCAQAKKTDPQPYPCLRGRSPPPPPPTPAPCLQLQGQTEAGALWSLLRTGGVTSPPRTTCVIYLGPWKPQGPLSSWPPCPGLWRVTGERSLSPTTYQDQNCGSKAPFSSNSPHPEFFAAHPLYCFPVAFWEPASWLFLAPFPPSGVLGIRPGSSLPRLTLPGEVRMELPHSAHQPQVRVLSPGWKPQSIQPSAASSGKLPPAPLAPPFPGSSRGWLSPLWEGGWDGSLSPPPYPPPLQRAPPASAWWAWDPM